MKLNDHVRWCIKEYPLLYRCGDFEASRMQVLEQMFLTLGNGMEYSAEEKILINVCEESDWREQIITEHIPELWFDPEFTVIEKTVPGIFGADEKFTYNAYNKFPFSPYPQSDYEGYKIFTVKELLPDWEEGFQQVLVAAIAYWRVHKNKSPDNENVNWKKQISLLENCLNERQEIYGDYINND